MYLYVHLREGERVCGCRCVFVCVLCCSNEVLIVSIDWLSACSHLVPVGRLSRPHVDCGAQHYPGELQGEQEFRSMEVFL